MPVFTEAEALVLILRLQAGGKAVVFTDGIFDLLHPGHLRCLQRARRLGGALLVGVNSDRSVRAAKGPNRPIVPAQERAEILAALACVDGVVIFDEETPLRLMAALRPDILAQCTDRADEAIVEARGDQVIRIPVESGYSTRAILEKIRSTPKPPALL